MEKNERQKDYLTKEEESDLKNAFDLFSNKSNGKLNVNEILDALSLIEFDKKNPKVFNFYKSISEYQKEKNSDGIKFEEFLNFINNHLKKNEISLELKEIFSDFIKDNSNDNSVNSITTEILRNLFKDIGEDKSEQEINEILDKVSKNGKVINLEEFIDIMINSNFP